MAINRAETALFDELQGVFSEVFQIPKEALTPQTQFGELPQWDSMGHMDLMVALEEKYGIEINAESISNLVNIPAIIQAVRDSSG